MIVPFDAVGCLLTDFWCVNALARWKLETVCLLLFNLNPASRREQKDLTSHHFSALCCLLYIHFSLDDSLAIFCRLRLIRTIYTASE